MTIAEQIAEIQTKYPQAWDYIKGMLEYREMEGEKQGLAPTLPRFDDNDEIISESED